MQLQCTIILHDLIYELLFLYSPLAEKERDTPHTHEVAKQ